MNMMANWNWLRLTLSGTIAVECVFSFENDGSASQIKGNPDNTSYWASYFGQLQDELQRDPETNTVLNLIVSYGPNPALGTTDK